MKDEMEDGFEESTGQEVICPRCRRVHRCREAVFDSYVDCGCGYSFYAFAYKGLRIIMPPNEAGYEPFARAMRRFVVTTGRCTDIPSHLYQDEDGQLYFGFLKQDADQEEQLENDLERFQEEFFGEAYLTKDMIYSICELFREGHDVELRKQKKGVTVIKLVKKSIPVPNKKLLHKTDSSKKDIMQLMIPDSGILLNFQAQDLNKQYSAKGIGVPNRKRFSQ